MRSNLLASAFIGLIAATTSIAASVPRAAACAPQPAGSGPKANPDTVAAFLTQPDICNTALSAKTPSGYVKQYSDLKAATTIQTGTLGFTYLKSYDVDLCASKCNAIKGCASINIYFERDPSLEPGIGASGCANPPSTTNIKCTFWESSVTVDNAVNKGQFRNKFQVAIAGSNGYTNKSYLISQAVGDIRSNSAQPYCSSVLGYTAPVTTQTVVQTSTPLSTLTSTGIATEISTITISNTITETATSVIDTTTTLLMPTTTFNTETNLVSTTERLPTTTTLPTTITLDTITISLPTTTTLTLTTTTLTLTTTVSTTAGPAQKRAIAQPSSLSKYPASIITSACSQIVLPVTVTRTITSVSTSTASTSFTTQITSTTTTSATTTFGSTTVNALTSTVNIVTEVSVPTITATTTTFNTVTVTEIPTVTTSVTESVFATISTTPVLTVTTVSTTTTTIPAPSACSTYIFQLFGGTLYPGVYIGAADPAASDNRVTRYGLFTPNSAITSARQFTLASDGRLSAISAGGQTNYWVNQSPQVYLGPYQVPSGPFAPFSCSIVASTAVANVAGATGVLSCRKITGEAVLLNTCSVTDPSTLRIRADTTVGANCIAFTIAAIPVCSSATASAGVPVPTD